VATRFGLGGQVLVEAGKDGDLYLGVLPPADRPQRVRQRPGRIGDDVGVSRIRLVLARVQIRQPAHRQTRQVRHFQAHVASHRQRQRGNPADLVDDDQDPAVLGELGERLAQGGLVVGETSVEKPRAGSCERTQVMAALADIDPAEHFDIYPHAWPPVSTGSMSGHRRGRRSWQPHYERSGAGLYQQSPKSDRPRRYHVGSPQRGRGKGSIPGSVA
jgi:hypothetical protein